MPPQRGSNKGEGPASGRRPPARERVLDAAAECFYNHGVNGTGVDMITSAAGVAKMSLYNNFASKDDVVLAYLQRRHGEWLELYRRRLASGSGARDGVRAVFDAYIEHAEKPYAGGFRGCGLLNAAAELPAGAPGRLLVRQHKEQVEALLVGHLAEVPGLPADRVVPLAEGLSFLLEGAMARSGLDGTTTRLYRARDLAMEIVDGATTRARR